MNLRRPMISIKQYTTSSKNTLTEHQRIIFNGDGYSDEWVKEAERRGTSKYQVHD